MVKLLVSKGADRDGRDSFGNTPRGDMAVRVGNEVLDVIGNRLVEVLNVDLIEIIVSLIGAG